MEAFVIFQIHRDHPEVNKTPDMNLKLIVVLDLIRLAVLALGRGFPITVCQIQCTVVLTNTPVRGPSPNVSLNHRLGTMNNIATCKNASQVPSHMEPQLIKRLVTSPYLEVTRTVRVLSLDPHGLRISDAGKHQGRVFRKEEQCHMTLLETQNLARVFQKGGPQIQTQEAI